MQTPLGAVDLRVLIVDNGSSVPLEPPGGFPFPLDLVRLPTNTGGSGGFNAGMRAALHRNPLPDYLWLLDSDARVEHQTLVRQLATAAIRPDAWAVGAAIAERPGVFPHEVGGRVDRRSGRLGPWPAQGPPGAPVEVDYVAACCALVRADVVADAGLLPDVFLNGDDAQWCLRVSAISRMAVLADPSAIAYHPRFDRHATAARYYQARNGFGVIGELKLGRLAIFLRAMAEVRRAINQELLGRRDLAELHLLGLSAALRGPRTGPAPAGTIRVTPARPIRDLAKELARAGHPIPADSEDRGAGSPARRLLLGPPRPIAAVPAKGGPSAWLAARTLLVQDDDRGVIVEPRWPMPLLRSALTLIRGTWISLGLAMRPPPPLPLPESGTRELRETTDRSLSVVVLSYNRREALRVTLDSLRADRLTRDAQIVVVDNASADGSAEMVAAEFPEITLIRLARNIGVAGFNRGVGACTGRLVLILDDDARPDHESLEGAIGLLAQRPGVGAVAFLPRHPVSGVSEWPFAEGMGSPDVIREHWPAMGSGNLVRRDAWRGVGGYEEEFFLYRNDTDLALKFHAAGRSVAFCPRWVVWHDSPVARSKTARWCELATRNWIWMARRHGRGISRWWGALAGWAWAHRLAGLSPRRQWAAIRGAAGGIFRGPPTLAGARPDGRAFRELLRLQISASRNRSVSRRSIVTPVKPGTGAAASPIVEFKLGHAAAPGVPASVSSRSRHSA